MKLTKLTLLATAATLVLGISSARAAIGVTTNYSKLHITGTVITNADTILKGNTYTYPIKKIKFGNKQLLDLFSDWTGMTWPTGAKLEVGWDSPWYGDVLVVDKTGTNVLFDAYDGVANANMYLDFMYEYGAYKEKYIDADPGSDAWTEYYQGYYYIYDDRTTYTYLYGYGGNTQNFKQAWDSNGDYTKWNDKENAMFPLQGDQSFLDNSDTSASAKIKANGHAKGVNYYLY